MSWKLFWQIVLLIIITAIVMTTVRIGTRYIYGFRGKPIPAHRMQK